ncbi:MAG: sulfite exporter TauE/SafE family protein [Planctomycetes bacterium]|jgi:hypothetical protein|nr:sulfite exporter TauE/SafE family protein [Planctomycetota bacterium]
MANAESVLTSGAAVPAVRLLPSTRRLVVWSAALGIVVLLALLQGYLPSGSLLPSHALPSGSGVFLAVFFAALLCEYVDSALGMGYGTTLTPILIGFGVEPLLIVPAILISEFVTGVGAGFLHHRDGNVDFIRDRRAQRVTILLSALSLVGTIGAVVLAVNIRGSTLKLAIAGIIVFMGVFILATLRRQLRFRASHIVALGAVAAFNKGLSGGGYGPLVTGGQVVSGVSPKHAVAITCVAEAFTCLVGIVAYAIAKGAPAFDLVVPLTLGAALSVPMATFTVSRLKESVMRGGVGLVTLALGVWTLIRALS